ncbi:MAG: hypothetical protein E6H61_01175 [Betaproteobacteria bacterium]|nr:MAG: hypothetical protein E6H61_01175 [Betaproteobacteria bacterium]
MGTIYGLIRYFDSKRFWAPLGATAILATATVAWAVTPPSVFELDGDVADAPGNTIADWNTLNGDCTVPGGGSGSAGGSNTRTCIGSENPPKIFTQGGSKDPLDISQWHWKPADTVPDKDTITHAYAASYTASPSGDKVVMVGGDRFAVNGDANIGAWFFQQNITLNSNGTFSGVHVDHDVFLVSAFVGGGGTAVLTAYEWDSSCGNGVKSPAPGQCADNNLRLLGSLDTFAITNSSPISNETWSYLAKFGGGTNTMPIGAFFEGGADLTTLFAASGAGAVPCFSSFLLETRSSQSTSAVLKDFVLGAFPECHISLTKGCQCTAFHADGSGFDYSFSGTVTNDGGGTVFNVTVTDQGKTYSCGSLGTGQSKNFPSADCTGPANTFSATTFPTTNQASATATTDPGGSGTTLSATTNPVSCSAQVPAGACTPSGALTVDKTCVTALQVLGTNVVVRVDYTGQVHNGGNVNINNVQVTEDDNADGSLDRTFLLGTLTPHGTAGAAACYTRSTDDPLQPNCPNLLPVPAFNQPPVAGAASYFPSAGTGMDPGRVQFSDTVRATGTDAFGNVVASHPVGSGVTAHCLICPFGVCPTAP